MCLASSAMYSYPLCWCVQGLHRPRPGPAPLTSLPSTHHSALAPKSGTPSRKPVSVGMPSLSLTNQDVLRMFCKILLASQFHSRACWTYRTPSPATACNQTPGPKILYTLVSLHSRSPIRASDKRSIKANLDDSLIRPIMTTVYYSMGRRPRVPRGSAVLQTPRRLSQAVLCWMARVMRASAHLCTPSASQKCRLRSANEPPCYRS